MVSRLSTDVFSGNRKEIALMRYVLVLCASLVLIAGPFVESMLGQSAEAELVGQVVDPSGAGVPNASIKVTNDATGISRSTNTNALGAYRVAPLSPGSYTLEVSSSGFKTSVKKGVT